MAPPPPTLLQKAGVMGAGGDSEAQSHRVDGESP